MKTAPVLDPLRQFSVTPSMPLVHTKMDVRIRGGLAVVATERLFRNREQTSIEATITFPVPVHATLVRLTARIGERELVAAAVARSAARDVYEDAIDRGKTTVLHEEVLRGVHQLSVGHVPPGAELAVRSTWINALSRHESGAALRIPTTVGEVYGRSPLAESDDLVHGPTLHTAELSVRCDDGTVELAGRVLGQGCVPIALDRPIDLIVSNWRPQPVLGRLADGRTVEVSVTPSGLSTRALNAVILVDRSGSMEEPCTIGADKRPSTKYQVLLGGLNAATKETLTENDRIQLWEFSSVPRKVGSGRGDQLAGLVRKLTPPGEGTEIGLALNTVAQASEASDFLLVTDGKSHALDVQALACTGKRFHVVLIGEDSLEANVGHLAALTGGQIFVASGAEAGNTIQIALAEMRSIEVVDPPRQDTLLAFRAGMRIEATPSAAPSTPDPDARLIGGFTAALQLPGMAVDEAERLAVENGIACHLTSLVLVDEAGETQNCIPGTRKVELSTPGMSFAAQAAPESRTRMACYRARVSHAAPEAHPLPATKVPSASAERLRANGLPGSVTGDLRRWLDRIDWETDPENLRRGDLSGLAEELAREIGLAARTVEVRELAAELQVPEEVIVLALLAAASPKNRAALRFARVILKGTPAARVAKARAALDL